MVLSAGQAIVPLCFAVWLLLSSKDVWEPFWFLLVSGLLLGWAPTPNPKPEAGNPKP